MAKLKSLTDLRFSTPFSPFNPFCNGLRRFRVAPVALLLAVGVGWSAPAASAQAVNFGSVNICTSGATTPAPCNKTLSLTFNIAAGTTIGSVHYLTLGAQNLDFKAKANDTSTTLCTAKTYNSATTCTVDVTFAPTAPGERNGVVELLDGGGSVLATTDIYGTGVGPAIAFSPSPQITVGFGILSAPGVAVDGSGNVFVADYFHQAVREILAAGGYTTVNTLSGGFSQLSGVAVDGRGNVFVADSADNAVKEILAVNGSVPANPTINTLGSGFNYPKGVAVDGSGNVFVADFFNNAVKEILAVNGSIPANPTINILGSGLDRPQSVAVDGSGNVFVGVFEILAVNGSIPANPTINTLGSGFVDPGSVAVDAAGDVFVADVIGNGGYGALKEILAVNGGIPANPTISILSSGNQPLAAAVDGRGDVFVSYNVSPYNGVSEIQRSQPPALAFAYTPVGTTSGDSPRSVQIQNIGNATLTGNGVLSDTVDFVTVAGPGIVPDCTLNALSLAPGAECNISFDFTPQSAGPQSATLTLSDDALNGNPATQTITLSGAVGVPEAQVSPLALAFGTIAFHHPKTLALTITNVGEGILTVSASIGGPSYIIAGSSTCTGGVTAGNSCTLEVQFSPVTIGSHVDILTLHANASTPTVTLHGQANGVGVKAEGPLQFGTIAFGSTKVLPLTITNIGTPGTITVGTKVGGPSYKVLTNAQNTCLAGIAAGQSCTLPIEFDPVSVGMHDDILTLTPSGATNAPSAQHLDGFAN